MFLPRVIDALPRLFVETSASYFTNGGGVGDGVGLTEVGETLGPFAGELVGLRVGD